MSFGYSIGDFILLTTLAYRTVQNARSACGAHDNLTREVGSLHIVLKRLQIEVSKPDSVLNRSEDHRRRELATLAKDCNRVLKVLLRILEKYNELSEEKKSVTKLWQRVRFGNGEMQDLGKIRAEVATYTQALTLFVNLLSLGTLGKMEVYMDSHGEDLREIKQSLHWVTASMQANSHGEKSILTSYTEDDKAVWKDFRRELIKEGFSSRLLDRHKKTIKRYVMELGERGVLDELFVDEPNPAGNATPIPKARSKSKTQSLATEVQTGNEAETDIPEVIPTEAFEDSESSDESVLEEAGLNPSEALASDSNEPAITKQNVPNTSCMTEADVPDLDVDDDFEGSDGTISDAYEESDDEESQPGPSRNRAQVQEITEQALQHLEHGPNIQSSTPKGQIDSDYDDNSEPDADDYLSMNDNSSVDGSLYPLPPIVRPIEQRIRGHEHRSDAVPPKASNMHQTRLENSHASTCASVEEVEDEDFLPGAHPNCETCAESGPSPTFTSEPKSLPSSKGAQSTPNVKIKGKIPKSRPNTIVDDDLHSGFDDDSADETYAREKTRRNPSTRSSFGRANDLKSTLHSLYLPTVLTDLSEVEDPVLPSRDFESRLDGRSYLVRHFADFDFSSGPEGLEDVSCSRLSLDQKEPFEQWVKIQRWDMPSREGGRCRKHLATPLAVESRVRSRSSGYASSVWGSASEREERRERLKLRHKYLKKTRGIASSRPPRLVVRLSSSAAKTSLSGPATEKIPLYPFVKPHRSKRYGSPLRTERGFDYPSRLNWGQADNEGRVRIGEGNEIGEQTYFDGGSRLSAEWGSGSEEDNPQSRNLRRRGKKAATSRSDDEAQSDNSLHTRLSFRPRRPKAPSTTANMNDLRLDIDRHNPSLNSPSLAKDDEMAFPTTSSNAIEASQDVTG